MAGQDRKKQSENLERVIKPSAKLFFIDKKLYRVVTSNRGSNIIYLYNIIDEKEQVMLLSDFKKHRKRAYTVVDVGRLLNRSTMQIYRYINDGIINPPIGVAPGGQRMFTKKSYYSEEDVFEIRYAISLIHRGRPRKDGKKINNQILTEQELRAKMGDILMLYTRTADGRFIPVWQEETY
jgi:hypothetical protein